MVRTGRGVTAALYRLASLETVLFQQGCYIDYGLLFALDLDFLNFVLTKNILENIVMCMYCQKGVLILVGNHRY